MARESKTRFAILGMLQLGPKSGYDIKKELERSASFFWNESYGQIYPMLKRIVDDDLATIEVFERDEQADRKLYTITDAGRAELERWLRQPADPPAVRDERLLKVYFGANVDPRTTEAHIERIRDQMAAQQREIDALRARLKAASDEQSEDTQYIPFWKLSLRYAEQTNEATLSWCEEAIALLQAQHAER